MDSDDAMLPDRLQKQYEYLLVHPEVVILGGQMSYFGNTNVTQLPTLVTKEYVETESSWVTNHPTVMYRRSVIERLGAYSVDLKAAEDFDLWLRMLNAGYTVSNLPDVLTIHRSHPDQVTRNNPIKDLGIMLRDRNKFQQLTEKKLYEPHIAPAGEAVPKTSVVVPEPAIEMYVPPKPGAPRATLSDVFDTIYKEGKWGAPLSSGPGSTMEYTEDIQSGIFNLIVKLGIKSVLDVGCGRCTWIRKAIPEGVSYLGIDTSSVVIGLNKAVFNPSGWTFKHHDLSVEGLDAKADLVICRDVMTHLPNSYVRNLLANIRKCSSRLLATDWPATQKLLDIQAGQWRAINLRQFGLKAPVKVFPEQDKGKTLALFELQ